MVVCDVRQETNLIEFGFKNPLKESEKIKTNMRYRKMADWKTATSGDVVKFEKEGDSLEGKFISYEESRTYKDSFALKIDTKEGIKVVFVSSIVIDLLTSNSIQKGQEIKVEFLGKKQNQAKTFEYKDYQLLFK